MIWLVLSAAFRYGFGTLFSVSIPLGGDCFGMDHFGTVLGMIFTASGFASDIIGPCLTGQLLEITGGSFYLIR